MDAAVRPEVIEKLVARLYALAVQDSKYGFAGFACSWGKKFSQEYATKQCSFNRSIKLFAKDCGIKSLNGSFYFFNGKIYERIAVDELEYVYREWLDKMGIPPDYAASPMAFKKTFLATVEFYCPLMVRNNLIAFTNRVVDLQFQSGPEAHAFSPEYHVLDYHPYRYDPEARAPMFMSFLRDVLPDKKQRDILQMFLGLGLVQTSTAYDETIGGPRGKVQLCLLLLGSGANGKSTLCEIITALFGRNHITSLDYDKITGDGDEGLRSRAALRGAVFNWSSDSDADKFGKKNTAYFKRIVSGEQYDYRLLGHDVAYASHCPYLIFNLNELPKLYDRTDSVLRRLQYVSFEKTVPRFRQNPNLSSEIIESELPGVFNWVWRGAREIRRRKFHFPRLQDNRKLEILSVLPTNSVKAWTMTYNVRQSAQVAGEVSVPIKRTLMYGSYKLFCTDNGVDNPVSETQFSRDMLALKFMRERKPDGMYYICYGVREVDFHRSELIENIREDESASRFDDPDSLIKDD